ncbi:phage regulatory CII family protein [Vibrio vulnificus]
MDTDIAMYEFRERKQRHLDAVCCDFVVNHDIEKLAKRTGMKGQLLRNKLNPSQPHQLHPIELLLICKASGDYTIINTLFADSGLITVAIPEKDEKNIIERVLLNTSLCGELSSDAMQMCTAERLPRSRKRKTLAKVQTAISNLVLLVNDLENRTTGLQPLVQMGSDFLTSGAPIPGFA